MNAFLTQVHFLPGKEFGYPSCKNRLLGLRLPQEVLHEQQSNTGLDPQDPQMDQRHFLFMSSFFNLASENMVRSVGALLKYLDFQKIDLEGNGANLVVSVGPLVLEDVVSIDDTSLAALQVPYHCGFFCIFASFFYSRFLILISLHLVQRLEDGIKRERA